MDDSAPTGTSLGYCRIYFLGKKFWTELIKVDLHKKSAAQMKKCGEILDSEQTWNWFFTTDIKNHSLQLFLFQEQKLYQKGDETLKEHWDEVKCVDMEICNIKIWWTLVKYQDGYFVQRFNFRKLRFQAEEWTSLQFWLTSILTSITHLRTWKDLSFSQVLNFKGAALDKWNLWEISKMN